MNLARGGFTQAGASHVDSINNGNGSRVDLQVAGLGKAWVRV